MVARVDGYLEGIGTSNIFAITEVCRDRVKHPKLWQEMAETVAWLMHESHSDRETVSQSDAAQLLHDPQNMMDERSAYKDVVEKLQIEDKPGQVEPT
ncbi:hypothetical protein N7463_007543 [Penicillium fimorum]|uniref:Uncharacterized protein n=1 Tax=Penicillium fimorum TaxID=1882269 RepID=A0A9W9XWH7_9EURO|nr:hypothetical protein N7463_007543 [Penicillium fimorum]